MDIKKALRKKLLKEEVETPKTWNKAVNMKALTDVAKGIELLCLGEYGNVFINKKEMKIAINLGDSNPFSLKELEDWVRWMCIEGPHDFISNFDIEIDMEWTPSGEDWERLG